MCVRRVPGRRHALSDAGRAGAGRLSGSFLPVSRRPFVGERPVATVAIPRDGASGHCGPHRRGLAPHEDFATLLRQVGAEGTVHPQSLQAIETTAGHEGQLVPVQFDPLSAVDTQRGELFLKVPGLTAAGRTRSFDVYFGPDAVASHSCECRLVGRARPCHDRSGWLAVRIRIRCRRRPPALDRSGLRSAGRPRDGAERVGSIRVQRRRGRYHDVHGLRCLVRSRRSAGRACAG